MVRGSRILQTLILFFLVIHVYDGDTIKVRYQNREEVVRLLCVNTPERGQPGYKEAKEFTREHLLGRDVDLEFDPLMSRRGKFGRLLCYIWVNGKLFNLELIRMGHSRYYTKYGPSSKYHTEFSKAISTSKR